MQHLMNTETFDPATVQEDVDRLAARVDRRLREKRKPLYGTCMSAVVNPNELGDLAQRAFEGREATNLVLVARAQGGSFRYNVQAFSGYPTEIPTNEFFSVKGDWGIQTTKATSGLPTTVVITRDRVSYDIRPPM